MTKKDTRRTRVQKRNPPNAKWERFDPTDIFAALNAARVKYLVVGGIAVILHGVNRFTWDVDLSVELTVENLERLERVLKRIGFVRRVPAPIQGLADPVIRKQWVEQRNMKVYSFIEQTPASRVIDVMVKPLRNFAQIYHRRKIVRTQGIPVPLVPVDTLIQMKQRAGRAEDLLDLKALNELT